MEKKLLLAKILGVIGLVLVWFPILITLLWSAVRFFGSGSFLINVFLLAALFPFALFGMILLFVVSLLSKTNAVLIGSLFGLMVFLYVAVTIFIKTLGLTTSEYDPMNWAWIIVIAGIAAFFVCYLLQGIFGAVLVRKLFKSKTAPMEV